MRASAAYEARGRAPPGATPAACAFFRRKTRRSWTWRELPWRVDLTRVQSTEDPDADDFCYEVEIELADASAFYSVPADALVDAGAGIARDLARACAPLPAPALIRSAPERPAPGASA